jgi:hypothetical protein
LAELARFLPIINAKAKKYNPVSKQCYWYAQAVYESIKRKYKYCDKIRGKAYSLRGTHLKPLVPCKVSKGELKYIKAQWSVRILEISEVEIISQVKPSVLDCTQMPLNWLNRCMQIFVRQKRALSC